MKYSHILSLGLFLILFTSQMAFAQEGGETEEEAKERVLREYQDYESSKKENKEEDLEATIEHSAQDLQDLSPINVEKAMDADQNNENISDGKIEDSYLSNMMDGAMKEMVQKYLKSNPFSKMPRDEVKSMIEVNAKGLPIGNVFEKNPKLLDMLIDWIRDPVALPKLFGIVNKPDKVKLFGIIVIAIFIISFVLNLLNSKGNLFKRILKKLGIFVGAIAANLIAFYILFEPNVKPTVQIIFKYFHL